MTDGADDIARKIRRAKTDPNPVPASPAEFEDRPEAANLIGIHAALTDRAAADVCAEFGGRPFSVFKAALTESAVAVLGPIGAEMARLMGDPGYLDGVLADGANRAGKIAAPILDEVYDIVGFLRNSA